MSGAGAGRAGTAAWAERLRDRLLAPIGAVFAGSPEAVEQTVICALAEGHVLIEGQPGSGKTTLAQALARATAGSCRRIQFTPDLLPAEVTGYAVPDGVGGGLRFREGPLFANVVVADEINRASPKTQSALLEAMEERQVTVDGETLPLPEPFLLAATQNPVELQGTYPSPRHSSTGS
ncbi:MoxR family ATPase [Streptomyces sp. XD-27]|uniref:AAA family ATPase n=1 Tax=Streptomyces sp. XD-27 TaxID=3062779 RepID=UPI0026F47859|nr:AAA family ATPase [Streptomyces sp. XD-27]WKX73763.1 AAA family ATPase [Streptomyces sp. XD-27]